MLAHVKSDKKAQNWKKKVSDKLSETWNKDFRLNLKDFTQAWFDSLGVSGGKVRIRGELRQLMENSLKWKRLESLR